MCRPRRSSVGILKKEKRSVSEIANTVWSMRLLVERIKDIVGEGIVIIIEENEQRDQIEDLGATMFSISFQGIHSQKLVAWFSWI